MHFLFDHDRERKRQAALDSLAIVDTQAEIAYDDLARLAASLCAAPIALVSLIDHDRQWFKARIGTELSSIPRDISFCDHAIAQPDAVLEVEDASRDSRFGNNPLVTGAQQVRFYAGAPIVTADGQALGAVCVVDQRPRSLTQQQREGLAALARQAALLLELRTYLNARLEDDAAREGQVRRLRDDRDALQQRNADLAHVAMHDALTGLVNRAGVSRLRQDSEAMSRLLADGYVIGVLDIDLFKQVNDRHGHLLGDRALRAVAQAISANIRGADLAARFGGEEFLLVFPATSLAGAYEVAERIRHAVASSELPFALTASIGLAAGDPQADTPEAVFERADQALYRAKSSGRNRVVADDTVWR